MTAVQLYVMPTCWGLPNPSPFVLKLMTWARMAGVPYDAQALKGPPRSPSGKVPYIVEPDGALVCDSSVIIEHLTRTRQLALDAHLTPERAAQARALQRLLEDHFYWVMVTDRWRSPVGWSHTATGYFGHLPWPLSWLAPFVARRAVLKALHGQGFGRMSMDSVWGRGREDLTALSTALGDQDYFFGEVSSVDAVAYGFLANVLAQPWEGELKAALQGHTNLMHFLARVEARWWRT